MQNDPHVATTFMPNGAIYAGYHEDYNGYPEAQLIGKIQKDKKGLVAKTRTTSKIEALLAKAKSLYELGRLDAATTIADQVNLAHLEQIRLNPELQGAPEEYFWLDELFKVVDVPMLKGRETFYDTTASAEYLDRMERSKSTKTKYDEIKYDLKKLVDKAYTPIEDMMTTIINPQNVDVSQIKYGFKWKRNQTALKALKDIGNSQGELAQFSKLTAGNVHSDNKSANELNDKLNAYLKANDVKITHIGISTKTFQEYTQNTWTKRGPLDLEAIRLNGGGVVPMPGIMGVTAVVDVTIPDNTLYCVNKPNALRLGEGPKIMRRFYDEDRDAEAIKFLDFHQYLAVNKQITKLTRKFGMTLTVATS